MIKSMRILLCLGAAQFCMGQQATTAAGGSVSGSGTLSSYSIGEPFSKFEADGTYSSQSGVIQSYTIEETLSTEPINAISLKWQAYPNPTTDDLQLLFNEAVPKGTVWSLYDLQGRRLKSATVNSRATTIGMQTLPSGTYVLRLNKASTSLKTFKIIKN